MSYTNVHRVGTEDRGGPYDEVALVDNLHEGNEIFSATDGEEMRAASEIVDLVSQLGNGEALVIRRVIF